MQIVVDGVLTHYELVNPQAKTPVIILHGWGQNSSHWLPLVKLLSDRCRYYLLDLPGFGGSKNLPQNSGVPEYSEFVNHFAAKTGLFKFILSGHSFGGQVAGELAVRHPEKLFRLVLIDPAIIRIRGPKVFLKILIAKIIKPLTLLLPPRLKKAALSLYTPPEYVKANGYLKSVLHRILRHDLSSKLHLIKAPTDIVWGSEDKVIPYKGKHLVESIPNASLHLIYDAGHQPHLTHPDKLAPILNQIFRDEPA